MADEKRRYPRIQSHNLVSEQGHVFRTLDLSREGMLLEMDRPAAPGARLSLNVALGETVVEVQGLVVRQAPRDNGRTAVAIWFDGLAPRAERSLREFLLTQSG